MKLTKIIPLIVICSSLSACQTQWSLGQFSYREPLEQGNLIESEQLEQVKIGMSRSEVFELIGEPVVRTPFHPQRLEYVYRLDRRDGSIESARVSVILEADKVVRVERS